MSDVPLFENCGLHNAQRSITSALKVIPPSGAEVRREGLCRSLDSEPSEGFIESLGEFLGIDVALEFVFNQLAHITHSITRGAIFKNHGKRHKLQSIGRLEQRLSRLPVLPCLVEI